MFEIKMGTLLQPIVKTSKDGGLSMEDLTEACVSKILSVSETAPPEIREQAKFFQDKLQQVIFNYLNQAAQSQKDTCVQVCVKAGEQKAANILRRL
jgi:hypothetical protein